MFPALPESRGVAPIALRGSNSMSPLKNLSEMNILDEKVRKTKGKSTFSAPGLAPAPDPAPGPAPAPDPAPDPAPAADPAPHPAPAPGLARALALAGS